MAAIRKFQIRGHRDQSQTMREASQPQLRKELAWLRTQAQMAEVDTDIQGLTRSQVRTVRGSEGYGSEEQEPADPVFQLPRESSQPSAGGRASVISSEPAASMQPPLAKTQPVARQARAASPARRR